MRPAVHHAGFTYDANVGPFAAMCKCANSVVPGTVARKEFWFFQVLHIAVWCMYNYGPWPRDEDGNSAQYTKLDWNDVKVITALTTFFEVFYTNQCFGRYMHLYSLTRGLFVTAQHLALEIRLQLRKASYNHARLVLRYYLAALLLFFEDDIQEGIAGSDRRLWDRLLRPEELSFLRKCDGSRSLMVLEWCVEVWLQGAKKAGIPANVQKSVTDRIYKSFASMRLLADTLGLPIPFQYYHLLCLMVSVCILGWAIAMGTTQSVSSLPVFFVAELIFMGMIKLASQLADPFGDDPVDFPVRVWMVDCFGSCERLLEYEHVGDPDRDWEATVKSEKRLDLGFDPMWADDGDFCKSAHHNHDHHHRHASNGGQGGYVAASQEEDDDGDDDGSD